MTRGVLARVLITACVLLLAGCSSNTTNNQPPGPVPPQPDSGGNPTWPDQGLTEAGLPKPIPDAGQLPGVEAGTTIHPCAGPGGGERAVIVAAGDYDDISKGTAALLQINRNGLLTDTQVRLGPINQPRAVTIRPDGLEAAIAFGSSSSDGSKPHGVVVVSLGPGGTQASILETKTLPGNAGPLYLNYITPDAIAVSRIGPKTGDVVPLTRQGAGFAIGTPYAVPTGGPQQIHAVPRGSSEALLLTAPMGKASQLLRLSVLGGTISALGAPVTLADRHYNFTMHPTVNVAYLPQADVSTGTTNPDPAGKLHLYSATAGGDWNLEPNPFVMPKYASMAAVNPTGDMIVFADGITGTGMTELYAINLDPATGKPISIIPSFANFAASMIFDISVTKEGHIVVSLQPSVASKTYDVVSFARVSPTAWYQCPAKVSFRGAAEFKVAP